MAIGCGLFQVFNPRPCGWGDAEGAPSILRSARFNPRPCGRGDPLSGFASVMPCAFQSTPLREGRRSSEILTSSISSVSIHAPARGATILDPRAVAWVRVSIHAPARGATLIPYVLRHFFGVSIHAPARGATPTHLSFDVSVVCINDCANGSNQPCKSRGVTRCRNNSLKINYLVSARNA